MTGITGKKSCLIVIPVYNEEETLVEVAESVISVAAGFADILFVNDGSTDGSPRLLEDLHSESPFLLVHNRRENRGYGATLTEGFDVALQNGYEYVLTMDCDRQHNPDDIIKFKNADSSADIVSGSRYLEDSRDVGVAAPVDRVEINTRITRKLNRRYGWNLTDAFCGYKRYRTSALKEHGFTESGYAFPMEFWALARGRNLKISELAVNRIYVTDDRSFGIDLDKKKKRYKYYLRAWQIANSKYSV